VEPTGSLLFGSKTEYKFSLGDAMPRPDVSDKRIPQILNAALKVFNRKGIAAARMEDIAREAKLSIGGVYWYYKGKDEVVLAIHNPTRHELALAALAEVQRKNKEAGKELKDTGLSASMVSTAQAMLDKTDAMLTKVREYGKAAKGVIDSTVEPLFKTSVMVLEASRNAFQILAAAGNIAEYAKAVLSRIAANFGDALCNIKNGFRRLFTMPDWSDLFGASTCSSTGGGKPTSPWAVENPFYRVSPSNPAASASMSASGKSAVNEIRSDPLKNTLLPSVIQQKMNSISSGLTLGTVG